MLSQPCRFAILGLGFLVSGQEIEANATPASETLVIGHISCSIKEEIETFRPLADYLGPRLSAVGIRKVKIPVATTGSEMSRRLASGEVDIYIDSPFVVARMSCEVAAKPLLRSWKKGVADLRPDPRHAGPA